MTSTSRFGVLLCAVAACSKPEQAIDSTSAKVRPGDTSHARPSAGLAVSEYGIGSIRAGMSAAEAFPNSRVAMSGCGFVAWNGAPRGVRVMVENGEVARVDVDSGTTATTEGIRVGDTESQVMQKYGKRVAVSPSKYTKGHYLTVTSAIAADTGFRLVFETENDRVVRYRGGRRPAVEYVEGCG